MPMILLFFNKKHIKFYGMHVCMYKLGKVRDNVGIDGIHITHFDLVGYTQG